MSNLKIFMSEQLTTALLCITEVHDTEKLWEQQLQQISSVVLVWFQTFLVLVIHTKNNILNALFCLVLFFS